MTRMIERWFPCAEVSENSDSGWGSGNIERSLFTWFAARPTAQAKAAVICSLLPWPEDEAEQKRLQDLVKRAMTGRYAAEDELRSEILNANPAGSNVLDPFCGRGIIPLEASRLGLRSYGIDYSLVAVLASALLTDFPFRDWAAEPRLPFSPGVLDLLETEPRLVMDVAHTLAEVGRRFAESMQAYYPKFSGRWPWGYVWAVTLPCQECGNRYPLVGSYTLRMPLSKPAKNHDGPVQDAGQSFYVDADAATGTFEVVVHDGPPRKSPTLANALAVDGSKILGKAAICPFCGHVHQKATHQRLAAEGYAQDVLLVVADVDDDRGKTFRTPTVEERRAAIEAAAALIDEPDVAPGIPARPNEGIAVGNTDTIRPSAYGAATYGDLMCARQTLGFSRLARTIRSIGDELIGAGISADYARALTGYAGANMVRQLKFSTRGARLYARRDPNSNRVYVDHIFVNESTIAYSYDFFEVGIGDGPGTWDSIAQSSIATLRGLMSDLHGVPATINHGTATSLPQRTRSISAVVTDPPYDEMIAYADASDLFYVWLKRALAITWPEMTTTADPHGAQDKADEIIVKRFRAKTKTVFRDHRTRDHYDSKIAQAFSEMRRVVRDDGVVTIVFGHGEPEVWQRLLAAIESAGLVMTGSWPARTEAGGQQGAANIETTLTMSCRPAPTGRPRGRRAAVESEIKAEIKERYPDWERWGLAPTDMLMAAAGPAMEIAGRFSDVLDARGEPVQIDKFLPLARAAVQEAMALEIEHHPLETFDARTRFALWWVRLFGRGIAPKSELRWQTLAASLDLDEVRDLVPDVDKGCQFVFAAKHKTDISAESSVIDVVLALGRTSDQGLAAMGEVFAASGREPDDAYLWSAAKFLADRLPGSDPDAIAFTRVLRNRAGVGNAASAVHTAGADAVKERERQEAQLKLF